MEESSDESSKPPLDQSYPTLCSTSSSSQSSSSESSDASFNLVDGIVRYPSTANFQTNMQNKETKENENKRDQGISTYGSYGIVHSQSVSTQVGDLNNPKLIGSETKRMNRLDFDFGKRLGHGSYGDVYIVKFKEMFQDKEYYAMKIIKKSHIMKEKKIDFVKIERDAMNRLNHPNIIRLKLTFQDKLYLYYVVELASNGDLSKVLKKHVALSPENNKIILAQVLSAIGHMHHRRVLHRDLKPENILLDSENRVKITDFGTAKIFELAPTLPKPDNLLNALNKFTTNSSRNPMTKDQIPKPEPRLKKAIKSDYISTAKNIPKGIFESKADQSSSDHIHHKPPSSNKNSNVNYVSKDNFRFSHSSFVGSGDYVSPEMLKSNMVGPMSDIWAFGCLVYTLFVGEAPFHTDSRFVTFRRIQENDFSIPDFVPSDARDLIEKILITDPEKRLGHDTYDSNYEDIREHPFFKGIDWSKISLVVPPPFESFEPAVKRREAFIEKMKKEEEMEEDPYNTFEQVVRQGPGKFEKKHENGSELMDVNVVLTNKLRIFATDASAPIETDKSDREGKLKTGPIYDEVPLTSSLKINIDNSKGTLTFSNDNKTLTVYASEKERKEWDEFIKEALLDL